MSAFCPRILTMALHILANLKPEDQRETFDQFILNKSTIPETQSHATRKVEDVTGEKDTFSEDILQEVEQENEDMPHAAQHLIFKQTVKWFLIFVILITIVLICLFSALMLALSVWVHCVL